MRQRLLPAAAFLAGLVLAGCSTAQAPPRPTDTAADEKRYLAAAQPH